MNGDGSDREAEHRHRGVAGRRKEGDRDRNGRQRWRWRHDAIGQNYGSSTSGGSSGCGGAMAAQALLGRLESLAVILRNTVGLRRRRETQKRRRAAGQTGARASLAATCGGGGGGGREGEWRLQHNAGGRTGGGRDRSWQRQRQLGGLGQKYNSSLGNCSAGSGDTPRVQGRRGWLGSAAVVHRKPIGDLGDGGRRQRHRSKISCLHRGSNNSNSSSSKHGSALRRLRGRGVLPAVEALPRGGSRCRGRSTRVLARER